LTPLEIKDKNKIQNITGLYINISIFRDEKKECEKTEYYETFENLNQNETKFVLPFINTGYINFYLYYKKNENIIKLGKIYKEINKIR
jgi:hypothetical protein